MSNSKKEREELPEVLEFLKYTRSINRQLKLLKNIKMSSHNKQLIKKAVIKTKRRIDEYLGG